MCDYFDRGTFSFVGERPWQVAKIVRALERRGDQPRRARIARFVRDLESGAMSTNERPGSRRFLARCAKSDLAFPILIVVRDGRASLADGNHRCWKAWQEGRERLPALMVNYNELPALIGRRKRRA